ncbi:MAG TPA: hypothetical protein VHZ03_42085 [Trebonia sp.]|jgi:hypothetical protein|nr:hypothetical protein [Trebonia sp.]
MTVNNDDLLPDLDHLGDVINKVAAEGLALPEPRTRAEEHQQGIPRRHGGSQRQNLSGRQQIAAPTAHG